jgi:hypothetical protein
MRGRGVFSALRGKMSKRECPWAPSCPAADLPPEKGPKAAPEPGVVRCRGLWRTSNTRHRRGAGHEAGTDMDNRLSVTISVSVSNCFF